MDITSNHNHITIAEIIRHLLAAQNSLHHANTAHNISGIAEPPYNALTRHLPWEPEALNSGSGSDNVGNMLPGVVAPLGHYGQLQEQQYRADNSPADTGRLLAIFLGSPPLLLHNISVGNSHQTNFPHCSGLDHSGLAGTPVCPLIQHGATSQGEPSTLQKMQTAVEQNYFPPADSFAPHESNQSANVRRGELHQSSTETQIPSNTYPTIGMVQGLDTLVTPLYGLGTATATSANVPGTASHLPSASTNNPEPASACASESSPWETNGENERLEYSTEHPNRVHRKRQRSESSSRNSEDNSRSDNVLKRQCRNKTIYHTERRVYNALSFAQKLFEMITDQEASGMTNVVEFLDGGGGFWLHDRGAISALMPKYGFRGTKFSGFRRQLTSYGFRVEKGEGPEKGVFKHPLFYRGRPDLCSMIVRDGQDCCQHEELENSIDLRQSEGNQVTQAPDPENSSCCSSKVQVASSLRRRHQVPKLAAPKRRAYKAESFVHKLFKMITDQESAGKRDVVEFLNGGGGFWLHDPSAIPGLMPQYNFRGTKFSGFRRQLTSYGFTRQALGPDARSYKNPLFSRGCPDLCDKIIRNRPRNSGSENI